MHLWLRVRLAKWRARREAGDTLTNFNTNAKFSAQKSSKLINGGGGNKLRGGGKRPKLINAACQRVDLVSFCFLLFRLTSLVLSLLLLPVCGRCVYENKQTNMAGVEVFDISNGSSGRDSFAKRSKFPWNERLSTLVLREIYFEKPYQYVAGTPESATAWRTIFTRLNENYPNVFPETVEKVRDHVRGILKKRATMVRELEKQSGIVEEETEFKTLMDDIIAERDDYLGQQEGEGKKGRGSERKEGQRLPFKGNGDVWATRRKGKWRRETRQRRKRRNAVQATTCSGILKSGPRSDARKRRRSYKFAKRSWKQGKESRRQ